MIKMKSERPLLIGGEARTDFETDEQHAKELEKAGLAVRVGVKAAEAVKPQEVPAKKAVEPDNKAKR